MGPGVGIVRDRDSYGPLSKTGGEMTQGPPDPSVSRRNFIIGSTVTGLTLLAGAGMGYVIARDEGGGGAAPGHDGSPTPAPAAEGPKPKGKVAQANDATLPSVLPSPR